MIGKYLDKGTMYVLEEDGIKGECVVIDAADRYMYAEKEKYHKLIDSIKK